MFLFSAVLGLAMQSMGEVRVAPLLVSDQCRFRVEGRLLTEDAFATLVAARHASEVTLVALDRGVPYRCVGGMIFRMQRAGVPVGFPGNEETHRAEHR